MEREREKMGSNGGGEEGRDGSECTQKDRIKRYLRKLTDTPVCAASEDRGRHFKEVFLMDFLKWLKNTSTE